MIDGYTIEINKLGGLLSSVLVLLEKMDEVSASERLLIPKDIYKCLMILSTGFKDTIKVDDGVLNIAMETYSKVFKDQ